MRQAIQDYPEPPNQVATTLWHGNIAAATWTQRNVSSVTESGDADITVTFQTPYIATPCAVMGGGTAVDLQGGVTSITASSVRMITKNSGNAAAVGRKSSLLCVGLM